MKVPAAADIIRQAAEMNRKDPRREGNTVRLSGTAHVIVAGDIHGSRANFAKIVGHAALASDPQRHLVLQEIIHGPVDPASGQDRSIELLMRAARLKCAHERQVLFVLGNHDLAQITGAEIVKDGRSYCKGFTEGIRYSFGEAEADETIAAVDDFLRSLPLAIVCDNGVLIAHSVPSAGRMRAAGTEILRRPAGPEDLKRGGCVYEWTWGRGHTPEQLDELAAAIGASFFILGHQQVSGGLQIISPRAIALGSDGPHGRIVEFSTAKPLSAESAEAQAKPIVALGA